MNNLTGFDEDWHVSSTFSDGSGTVAQNAQAAGAAGLRSLCVVDKARRTSPWIRDLADACQTAEREVAVRVRSGIEVEVVDTSGALELPPFASCVDRLFIAAERLPTPRGPISVVEAREQIAVGELLPARAVEWMVRAYANATHRPGPIVLSRPFSLLPRLGISPQTVHPSYVRWLAGVMLENQACSEVNEAWQAPSMRVLDCLLPAGVPVLPTSGARAPESIGRYDWCPGLLGGLSSLARAA